MQFTKKDLYRKVNTKARGVSHDIGSNYKYSRHKKRETVEQTKGTMHGKYQRGYDYTPLHRFLLKKVGSKWDEVHSEAVSRLDQPEPIFWLVAIHESEKREYVRVGESSYWSGMYVDEQGILRLVTPTLTAKDIGVFCPCCTHTFNGEVYSNRKSKR